MAILVKLAGRQDPGCGTTGKEASSPTYSYSFGIDTASTWWVNCKQKWEDITVSATSDEEVLSDGSIEKKPPSWWICRTT